MTNSQSEYRLLHAELVQLRARRKELEAELDSISARAQELSVKCWELEAEILTEVTA